MVEDDRIVWGYENERVSGVKSDSRFPSGALSFNTDNRPPDIVYATHWSPDGALSSMGDKYWKPETFDGVPIVSLRPDFTHHDAHLASAMSYAGPAFPNHGTIALVVDGFGNFGEHFSVYRLSETSPPHLIRRYRGYDTSLGLWYQYATAFMGLKMHEDEYKLLGYEAHATDAQYKQAMLLARDTVEKWLQNMQSSIYRSEYDPVYNLNALAATRERVFAHLTEVCKLMYIEDPTSFNGRCGLSVYVQAVLEQVVLSVLQEHRAFNVLLSGGVFFNVKLNLQILRAVPGMVCISPLAGDQGNALGLYAYHNPNFKWPKDLNWGRRALRPMGTVPNLVVLDEEAALDEVVRCIRKFGFVNLVRGDMEFGPRALCNTSTLALPHARVVEIINDMNARNTVMPMAPVMTRFMYSTLFRDAHRLWNSEKHMICAMEFLDADAAALMLGAAHAYNHPRSHYTGRPQVVEHDDFFMRNLLEVFDHPLINTSFNYHGKPIALGMSHVIDNHMMQYRANPAIRTVVIRNDI